MMRLLFMHGDYWFLGFIALVVVQLAYTMWRRAMRRKINDIALDLFRSKKFTSNEEMAWYIAHDVMGAVGFEDCVVYKVDHELRECIQLAAYGPKNLEKKTIVNPIQIPFGRGIVGHVAEYAILECIDDTSLDDRYVPDDDVRYSELSVPVMKDDKVVMVIDSERKKARGYSISDQVFVVAIAEIAAAKFIR